MRGVMNKIRQSERLKAGVFYVVASVAVMFLVVMVVDALDENRTPGMAGTGAAIVALCTVLMGLMRRRARRVRPNPNIYITLGTLVSAYLAVIHSFGSHVLDPLPPFLLAVYGAIAAIGVFGVMLNSR